MENKQIITEHIDSVWKTVILTAFFVAVCSVIILFIINDPLLKGIFRLLAFAGFAAFVLAFLQKRGKIQKIEVQISEEHVSIFYYRSSRKIQEELFELQTIDQIKGKPAPPAWHLLPRRESIKFIISFTDTKNRLSLFRVEGQDVYISKTDAGRMEEFLEQTIPQKMARSSSV